MLIPTDLNSFFEMIRQHGDMAYSLLFAFAAWSHMATALFAGYAAQSGVLDFPTLVVVLGLGSFFGDAFRFWIGRRFGAPLLQRFPRFERPARVVTRLADRHYAWMILIHRYPMGIRAVAGFAYGMSRLSWPVFLGLSFVAAGLWAGALVSVGYAFGQVSDKLVNDASSRLAALLLIAFLGLSWLLSKRLARALERAPAAPSAKT